MDERLTKLAERFPRLVELVTGFRITELLPIIKMNLGMLTGKPSKIPMRGMYVSQKRRPIDRLLDQTPKSSKPSQATADDTNAVDTNQRSPSSPSTASRSVRLGRDSYQGRGAY